MELHTKVLKRIKPSKAEEKKMLSISADVMSKIRIPDAKPQLGGSSAKGTWLSGGHDIDVYVKFDGCKYAGKDISVILKQALQKSFKKLDLLHGSRDYFQTPYKGYTIEIVPILEIREAGEAANITDISPLHVEWVRKHSDKADQIRLAKAFCKAGNIYGAESYIKGFSGYVLEILTAYYGSFHGLICGVAKWNPDAKMIIDIEGYYKGQDIMKEMNLSKIVSPLILIDPVQKERNAAAGVGQESYETLIMLARSYLASPSERFFIKQKVTKETLKKKAGENILLTAEATPLQGKKDVVGAKLLKCLEYMQQNFAEQGFKIIASGWNWGKKVLFWFIFPDEKLSKTERHDGPPTIQKNDADNFRKTWGKHKILEENGRLYVMKERSYTHPTELLKHLLKDKYVKERVKVIR